MARDFDARIMYTPHRLTDGSFLQISADDKLSPHYMTVSKKEQICHKLERVGASLYRRGEAMQKI